jgi:hypothetical protein
MQIRIRQDAAGIYCRRFTDQQMIPDQQWAEILRVLAGEVLEVETDYLFANQFNTAPVSKERAEVLMRRVEEYRTQQMCDRVRSALAMGVRIMQESIEEIVDDVRPGMMRCSWCGKSAPVADVCPHCEKNDHLEQFRVTAGV